MSIFTSSPVNLISSPEITTNKSLVYILSNIDSFSHTHLKSHIKFIAHQLYFNKTLKIR